jgi:hypothetical protein
MPRFLLPALTACLLGPACAAAAPVAVRFAEGVTHGFLVLRTLDGGTIASGDLLQELRDARLKSRMVFRFKDGSILDETAVFSQDGVFTLQSYRLLQRGPVFAEDSDASIDRAAGRYRVATRNRKDGREEVLEGALVLPPDTYNGMVLTVAKNLAAGARAVVHMVAFTPAPRLVQLELVPSGTQRVLVGELEKSAVHFVFKPRPGAWLTLVATVLGRMPPDSHAWIVTDEVPAFVRYEGPLHPAGPAWHIELTSPRWPDQPPLRGARAAR